MARQAYSHHERQQDALRKRACRRVGAGPSERSPQGIRMGKGREGSQNPTLSSVRLSKAARGPYLNPNRSAPGFTFRRGGYRELALMPVPRSRGFVRWPPGASMIARAPAELLDHRRPPTISSFFAQPDRGLTSLAAHLGRLAPASGVTRKNRGPRTDRPAHGAGAASSGSAGGVQAGHAAYGTAGRAP